MPTGRLKRTHPRRINIVNGALFALAFAHSPSASAEPAACLSPDPSAWPAASRPYFMILVDTSGSMISQVPPTPAMPVQPSCGYPATRMGHAKCAVKNSVLAFSGEASFGLAQYAAFMSGCGANCYGNASSNPFPACTLQCFNAEKAQGGCFGCGPYDNIKDPTTGHGANLLVGMQVDNVWMGPPAPSNVPEILKYVDNDCSNDVEITSVPSDGPENGLTPLNGALRDMKRYFQSGWHHPDDAAIFFPTPLSPNDRPCRSVNVILLTDGDETCDTQQDAINAATALYKQGVTVGANTFKIKTHVINFAGGNQFNTDAIAAAGGTQSSYFATNEVDLAKALANIISGAIKPETCDNVDNNCNGCTDEGFTHYCDVQPVAGYCCTLARTTCLGQYQASITALNPGGDLSLLPCTTPVQAQQPANWLCFDPKEKCDDIDNNCYAGVDEGMLKCGSPLACPTAEVCDGKDNNCNGIVDEGGVCPIGCVPSPEVCDGCDNNCDGLTDNGVATVACGLSFPPNCAGVLSCKPPQAVPPGGCVVGGGFQVCNNNPQPEVCDGKDNDCNGLIDDNVPPAPCVPPGTPPGLVYGGTSHCKMGQKPCNGTCQGFIGPSIEVCDGIDNDCNGVVDDGVVAVGQPCGVNQAPCKPGLTACVNGALTCQGGISPQPEICNGKDDNCDGQIDEAPLADAPPAGQTGCWAGLGNCCKFANLAWCPPPGATCFGNGAIPPPCNSGALACAGAAGWVCHSPKGPTAEVCDGVDNDCNGLIDDGAIAQVGTQCGSDVGACKPGVLECKAGSLKCVGAVNPSPEMCDGLDNDCNGKIDDNIPAAGPCAMAYDAMLFPGDRSAPPCQPGLLECNGMGAFACVGGVGPSAEICDGIDNDCDGTVDETGPAPDGVNGSKNPLVPPPAPHIGDACGTSVGECHPGTYACAGGLFACLGTVSPEPEICDCLDNDCDGTVDEPPSANEPPLCSPGKDCVKTAKGACQCAAPCGKEFPCPAGQVCEAVVSSFTGKPLGGPRCVTDLEALCGDCSVKIVKDAQGAVVCAPAGTVLDGCVVPPVCACKGQNGCQDPCFGVSCANGTVCAPSGPRVGKCVVDTCFFVPCQGCGVVCNKGACVHNPCAPNPCKSDEVCKPKDNFTAFDCKPSCAGVSCPLDTTCLDGACTQTCAPACPAAQVCDMVLSPPVCVTDHCQPNPCADGSCCDPVTGACGNCPCEGVVCPSGQTCSAGQCQAVLPGPGSATTGTGPATSGVGGAPVFGLATGGGGCSCRTTPGPTPSGAVLLAGVVIALARKRFEPRRRRACGATRIERPFLVPAVSAWVFVSALTMGAAGCATNAFCYTNCDAVTSSPAATTSTGGGGSLFPSGSVGVGGPVDTGTGGACGNKAADGTNFDYTSPKTCGTCDNDCYKTLLNNDPLTITCEASVEPGKVPGRCHGACATDYYDLEGSGNCTYYCVKTASDDKTCDHKDDDCDGKIDEDVDTCKSAADCGSCGHACSVAHGAGACAQITVSDLCTPANTQCAIAKCDCTGPGNCYWDMDGAYATGCEYPCYPTNGGVEICGDGIDNDCNGKIDEADDLSKDAQIGVSCFGAPEGECHAPEHAGITLCAAHKVVCGGANVLLPGQHVELCNGKDDDCDGMIDDNLTDTGGACGTSNLFPCSFGAFQCKKGVLVCAGAVNPGVEVCNGQDDDCDGAIDMAGGKPPADSIGPCNVPIPPPPGASSPCTGGTKACVGGTIQCLGFIGPTSPSDGCGVDANCDGQLTNQPDLSTDPQNCGACGVSCLAGAVHANWTCAGGACKFLGCQAGYYDLDNDKKCEYACTFVSSQEACNGVDDNCNGQIDEGVIPPLASQVCGTNPSAKSPECSTAVAINCQNGGWTCTFPAGVCDGGNPKSCAATPEVCDTLDNNCNGLLNENVPGFGKPCASDDGLPPPGHGACRTLGTNVCNGLQATKCTAVKESCANLPGGCTEVCDGIDNDCDGLVDEPYTNKGPDPAHFVKPAVAKVGPSLWMMTYEASRPNATMTVPGSGNGYRCSTYDAADPLCNDISIPTAPAGVTLDKTNACSVPGKIPWFNVTPVEAEQACNARGGRVCATSEWQTGCKATTPCEWGFSPRGTACDLPATVIKYCNLGATFDFDPATPGTQQGLLVTSSTALKNCSAEWQGLLGNFGPYARLYDITGNLREITKSAPNVYPLMGGSFKTSDELGATCNFTFYTVDRSFELFDLGFRCCFGVDPTK